METQTEDRFKLRTPGQRTAVAVVYVASNFVVLLDSTIINLALPAIGRHFVVDPTAVGAIAISYMVAMGAVVPISGWLADRVGTKRVLLSALLAFTVTSVLCGLATGIGELVVFRILQGLAGGMLAPVGLAMLFQTFPTEERVRISTYTMIPTLLAPAAGPVLGGALVSAFSWRWVFFINVPIGLAGALFGLLFVKEARLSEHLPALDLAGFALSTVSVGLLMFGLAEGTDLGWTSPAVLAATISGALLLVLTIRTELRRAHPLLALRLFADRRFRSGNAVVATSGAAFISTLFGISLYFQYGRGLSPLQSGLSTFPEALGVLIAGQVGTHLLYDRLGARRLVTAGVLCLATTISLLATMGAHTSLWWGRLIIFGVGLSTGQLFIPNQVSTFSTIEHESTNGASVLFTVVRQITNSMGIAMLTTVIGIVGATRQEAGHSVVNLGAYRWQFLAAGALALLGLPFTRALARRAG
jgi:EmrB/QacA subfamily drug resistance transporter